MARQNGTITFTVGALAGIIGGFILGIFFGKYALHLVSVIYSMVDRRDSVRENRRFEWLLQ